MSPNWYKSSVNLSTIAPTKLRETFAWIWEGGKLTVADGALHGVLVSSDYPNLDNMFRGTYWVEDDHMIVIVPRKPGDVERKGVEDIPNSLYNQLLDRFGTITNIEVL